MNIELQPQASTSLDQTFDIPEPDYQAFDTPISERTDSNSNPSKRTNQGENHNPLE
jgi:hypothetical protein